MRTLIIGSGFVGRALAARLVAAGGDTVLASRRPPGPADAAIAWTPLDVVDRQACELTIAETDADAIVLVHGPSDVTWCERHPAEALAGHAVAARYVAELAGDRRIVMISTDNVFDGTATIYDESSATSPANAYGRAKLAAEEALRHLPNATALRVSLIYGWEPAESTKWLNFFSSCAHQLRLGQPVVVPSDQWTTPVLVDDVTAVTAAVLGATALPVLHLGGPNRVSRAEWAAVIAEELGADPALVQGAPRAGGRYADRPENTCLRSTILATEPTTAGIRIRGVRECARTLLDEMVSRTGSPGVIRALRSRTVYRNAWMTVREDDVERADGSTGIYGVVDKPDFALVIPATPDGFYLVEQYRYPAGGRFWEFPQGSWAGPDGAVPDDGADTAQAWGLAAAELREETGLSAGTTTRLGRLHVAYGYANQGCQVFLARDLTIGRPEREASEADMVHRFVPYDEFDRMIREGRITDATSLAALALLDRCDPAGTRRSEP